MDSRELYPSDEQRRRIMDFIMAAGETLLENGAEVFRVEQTMEIMARSFHLREFHVYVLTNGIFASAGTAEIAEVRNVPVRTTHLGRVVAVNALSREIAAGGVTLDEAEHRLAEARRIPFPKGKTQLLAGMSGTACFALIFGGTIRGSGGGFHRQRLSAAVRKEESFQRLPQDLGGSAHYIGLHSGVPSAGH